MEPMVYLKAYQVYIFTDNIGCYELWSPVIARRRFYPRRSSGQAVVTGVVPSPPPVRAFISCRA